MRLSHRLVGESKYGLGANIYTKNLTYFAARAMRESGGHVLESTISDRQRRRAVAVMRKSVWPRAGRGSARRIAKRKPGTLDFIPERRRSGFPTVIVRAEIPE